MLYLCDSIRHGRLVPLTMLSQSRASSLLFQKRRQKPSPPLTTRQLLLTRDLAAAPVWSCLLSVLCRHPPWLSSPRLGSAQLQLGSAQSARRFVVAFVLSPIDSRTNCTCLLSYPVQINANFTKSRILSSPTVRPWQLLFAQRWRRTAAPSLHAALCHSPSSRHRRSHHDNSLLLLHRERHSPHPSSHPFEGFARVLGEGPMSTPLVSLLVAVVVVVVVDSPCLTRLQRQTPQRPFLRQVATLAS